MTIMIFLQEVFSIQNINTTNIAMLLQESLFDSPIQKQKDLKHREIENYSPCNSLIIFVELQFQKGHNFVTFDIFT